MLERTDAITNEVLEPITFVLAYPTVQGLGWWPRRRPRYCTKSDPVRAGLQRVNRGTSLRIKIKYCEQIGACKHSQSAHILR
jgi:hypothetical protein